MAQTKSLKCTLLKSRSRRASTICASRYSKNYQVTITPRPGIRNEKDYEFDLRIYDCNQIEEFSPTLNEYTLQPVNVQLTQIQDNLKYIPYDWCSHWSHSLQTYASLAQFVHFFILPFIDIEEHDGAKTFFPTMLPTPGCTVPEIVEEYQGKDCYIGSFHVSEVELRAVITQERAPEDLEFQPILLDIEFDKIAFEELLELKTEFGPSDYDDYLDCFEVIDEKKNTDFKEKEDEFRHWIQSIIPQDLEFKEVYVSSDLNPDQASL